MRANLGLIRDQIELTSTLRDFFLAADVEGSGTVPLRGMAEALEGILNVQEISSALQIYPKQVQTIFIVKDNYIFFRSNEIWFKFTCE